MFPRVFILSVLLQSSGLAQLGNPTSGANPTGQEVPVFDPSNETITFLGKTFTLKDTRIGLHFESYLASDEYKSTPAQEYHRHLISIKNLLHPGTRSTRKVNKAHALLRLAAKYPGDHNVSESLGAAVTSALSALDTIKARDTKTKQLERERAKLNRKLKFLASRSSLDTRKAVGEPPKGNSNTTSADYLATQRRINQINLLIKKNEVVGVAQLLSAKIHFQALLVQMFMQRRFEHVVIGCRFYMNIFQPTNASLTLKKGSIVSDFFKTSAGVSPTISGLEAFAEEAIYKVRSLVNISENHIKRGELHAASNRLLEAFAIGEHLTFIQQLPLSQKSKLYQYSQVSNNLMDAIEARDFTTALKMNDKLKLIAKDYRHTRIEAYISGFTKASNSHALRAFVYLSQEDEKQMFIEINNAKELWPNNPKIQEFYKVVKGELKDILKQESTYQQAAEKFDQLINKKAFLTILSHQHWSTFTTQFNIKNDLARLDTLRTLGKEYEPLLLGLKKCEALADTKQPIHAWELCKELSLKYPAISELQVILLEYRTQVTDFADYLDAAKAHIKKENYGSALNCYLKAKLLFPESKYVELGITQLLKQTQ